jgi:hypothetical protein
MYTLIAKVKLFYESKILTLFEENRQLSAFQCIADYKKALSSLYDLKEHYEKLEIGEVKNGDK